MAKKKRPPAPHRDTFLSNLKEVERLLQIHKEISGDGPGYKHNVEILNKSALIFLVAMWESYIEELATNSFEFLIENCITHEQIPNIVLAHAAKKIRKSSNELDIWELAGDGWIEVLDSHKEDVIKKYVNSLNTPRT